MKIYTHALWLLVILTVLLFVVPPGFINSEYAGNILTINTFLFGIFAGFCIAVTTADYNAIRSYAAEETGGLIGLWNTVKVHEVGAEKELGKRIGHYLIRSFDYDFINYTSQTQREFQAIQAYINNLKLYPERSSIHQNILSSMSDLNKTREHLMVLGTRSLSPLEWIVLYALGLLTIVTLYGIRTDDLFFNVVTITVSVSIGLVLILINNIDRYVWNEATFSFKTYNDVFIAMRELPYYPKEFIDAGIVTPQEKKYRVGILREPGKSFKRKIVVV